MNKRNFDLIDNLMKETVQEKPSGAKSFLVMLRERLRLNVKNDNNVLVYGVPNTLVQLNRVLAVIIVLVTLILPPILFIDSRFVAKLSAIPDFSDEKIQLVQTPLPDNQTKSNWQLNREYFRGTSGNQIDGSQTLLDAADAPGLSQHYTLMGILNGIEPKAIIRENLSGNTIFLSQNQQLNGYLVHEIKDNHIILEQDGELIELKM